MSKPEKAPAMNKLITGLGDLRAAVEGKSQDVWQAAASEQSGFCRTSRRGARNERKPPPMVRTSGTAGRKANNNQVHPQYRGSRKECQAMNKWYEQAKSKLEAEKGSGNYDRYASAMKGAVCEALDGFCRQDAEFAQAVVQGGTFTDCMKAVSKSCGSAISDLEAFRRAVRFYFPGADVKFHMTVNLCADVEAEAEVAVTAPAPSVGPKILNLEDFL